MTWTSVLLPLHVDVRTVNKSSILLTDTFHTFINLVLPECAFFFCTHSLHLTVHTTTRLTISVILFILPRNLYFVHISFLIKCVSVIELIFCEAVP